MAVAISWTRAGYNCPGRWASQAFRREPWMYTHLLSSSTPSGNSDQKTTTACTHSRCPVRRWISSLMAAAAPRARGRICSIALLGLGIMAPVEMRHPVLDLHDALQVLAVQQVHAVWADRDVVVVAVALLDVVHHGPSPPLKRPQRFRRLALPFSAVLPLLDITWRALTEEQPHPHEHAKNHPREPREQLPFDY